MKLKRVWQQFAERLRFNTLLVIVLLATNIGFAQERRHVLKDEMESALATWTESLTDADVPCKTKLVQVTPEQLKPIIASYQTSCRVSGAKGSLHRERKITVLLRQVTWQGLPISEYAYSQGYESSAGGVAGASREITIDMPLSEARKTIEAWWSERKLEVKADSPEIFVRTSEVGEESLQPDVRDARKTVFVYSFSE